MRESSIEKYFVKKCKAEGMLIFKMSPTYNIGIPDRQVLFRGVAGFAEIKAPGKEPRALQIAFLDELSKAGSFTGVVDSKESAIKWIEHFRIHVLASLRPQVLRGKSILPIVDKDKIERFNKK